MSESDNKAVKKLDTNKRGLRSVSSEGDLSNLIYGKIQPQAIPLEEVVLGAIMIDKDALPVVLDILSPDSFYAQNHQEIYRAMLQLFEQSRPIDLLTVFEQLKKNGEAERAGGPTYLVDLTNKVASAANIEYHARIIAQKHIQRELIRVSTQTINNSFDDTMDVFDLLDDAEKNLFDITQNNMNRGYESLSSLLVKTQRKLEQLSEGNDDGLTGIPSGFSELDKLTSGWQPSDLIIVAARPGMGKTAFTLSLAKNAAMNFKQGVAIFSLEMASVQLVQRLVSMEAQISSHKLRTGKLSNKEWETLYTAVEKMSEVPIYIDDTPAINVFELRAKCRRLKMQHDIQLIIIDYLQLMNGSSESRKGGTREQEISSISRALKGLAKELNVPVIALSQLSRSVETRGGDKRPMLSDLRESGAIEQDADIVSFIYRPEYYDITEDETGMPLDGVAEIIVAKHRNGATESVKLKFVPEYARFENLDEFSYASSGGGDFFGTEGKGSQGVITRSSRMNIEDAGLDDLSVNLDEDIPF